MLNTGGMVVFLRIISIISFPDDTLETQYPGAVEPGRGVIGGLKLFPFGAKISPTYGEGLMNKLMETL